MIVSMVSNHGSGQCRFTDACSTAAAGQFCSTLSPAICIQIYTYFAYVSMYVCIHVCMYVCALLSFRHNSLHIAAQTKSKPRTISKLLAPSRQTRKNPQKSAKPVLKKLSDAIFFYLVLGLYLKHLELQIFKYTLG